MIAKPTTVQLIEAARHDLQERVAPFVTDPVANVALQMSILVLGSAMVRAEHELPWMLEEADEIETVARRLVTRLPSAEALSEALWDYEQRRTAGRNIAEVTARYERASELLSRAAEAAYEAGDPAAIREVMALFEQRRDHQNAVTGGYGAVGRT
jgi:hypothetical protein